MDLISIIVPIYKVEKYLDECIRSVVSQTYKNIEIILVDDGSPDSCPGICDAWAEKDSRIRVIHKENGGLSDARNVGMASSTGTFIAFVDSDDILEPEYIEYMYRAICETGADLAQCRYQQFTGTPDAVGNPKSMCSPVIQSKEEALHYFSSHMVPLNHEVWDKLYRRSLIENERFLYGRQAQNVLFSCHVFGKCNKIARVDNMLYHYRIHSESASGRFIRQRLDGFETFMQSINYLEEFYPQYVNNLKRYYITMCFGTYAWIMDHSSMDNKDLVMKTVNAYRRRLKYSKEEWAACSLRDKIRYICSMPALIKPATRIRNFFL